jgi:hypothetical protein
VHHAIAGEFVGAYFSWRIARFKKSLQETLCSHGISTRLQVHIDGFAILIDSTPQIVVFTLLQTEDFHEHFV